MVSDAILSNNGDSSAPGRQHWCCSYGQENLKSGYTPVSGVLKAFGTSETRGQRDGPRGSKGL